LDARCSTQFIMQLVDVSFIHTIYLLPRGNGSGLPNVILIAVMTVIVWTETELIWYQEPY
jgi:hypothetical protein